MLKLRRVDIERSEEIFKRLDEYVEKLVKVLDPVKVILFGSFARGDFDEGSDVDLIVIREWGEGFLDRIKVLLDLNEFKIPIEPIGYTEEEFERMIEEGSGFALEVLGEGKVLYERGSGALEHGTAS